MPNHTTNPIERNIAEDNKIKDIRNLYRSEKKKDKSIKKSIKRCMNLV